MPARRLPVLCAPLRYVPSAPATRNSHSFTLFSRAHNGMTSRLQGLEPFQK